MGRDETLWWSRRRLLALAAATALGGCTGAKRDSPSDLRPFQIRDLAKADVDIIAEITLREVRASVRTLMLKLYLRNPREWRRTGKPSAELAIEQVFHGPSIPDFAELAGARGVDSIRLAFHESYTGDRVLAYAAGLASMIDDAYGGKREFFITDTLDPQRLYDAARNVEIAAWMLDNKRRPDETLYLLSSSRAGEPRNLSYERLVGKIVGLLDMIATVLASRTNRTIRKVFHNITTLLFLPI